MKKATEYHPHKIPYSSSFFLSMKNAAWLKSEKEQTEQKI